LKQRRIYLKLRPVAGTTTLAVAVVLTITPVTDAAVRGEVDRLTAQVTAARHLPFHGALPARAITRDAADAQIGAALAARITTSDLAAEEHILKRLGLIASSADYAKLWAASASAATVATYDPATKRLLVPDFLPLDGQRVALIHEIAHAVADQRFDLRGVLAPPPQTLVTLSGDATRARLALVEGDATLTTMEAIDGSGAIACAPPRARGDRRGWPRWAASCTSTGCCSWRGCGRARPGRRSTRCGGIRPPRPNRCCTRRHTTLARPRSRFRSRYCRRCPASNRRGTATRWASW
jgi:hypothetical protein